LPTAAGLNLHTVQRIENLGAASMQSMKALASALEVDLDELKLRAESENMKKWEYRSLVLPFKFGKAGREGWQLRQMIMPSSDWGRSDCMVAILERIVE
jgi:hypothetical protein